MSKTCTQCKERKPSSAYHKDSRKADGLSSACAQCRNASKRAAHKSKLPTQPEKKKNAIDANSELNLTASVPSLKDIVLKHNAFTTLGLSRDGKYVLSVHSRPKEFTIHGTDMQEVFDLALSS